MKYLLYSKRFRNKLCKWLIMYCCVICLFTLVITYSRYITSNISNQTARVAKFNVVLKSDKACISKTNICDLGIVHPVKDIDYYFTADTTEVEVDANLIMTISINTDFENYKLYDLTNNKLLIENEDYEINTNNIIIKRDINNLTRGNLSYKLSVEYKNYASYDQEYSYANAVKIGYIATQK